MARYQYVAIKNDCLKVVLFLGYEVYTKRILKQFLLPLMAGIYTFLLLWQLFDFMSDPTISNLASFGSFFFEGCYNVFTILVLLLEDKLLVQIMAPIHFWKIKTAGDKIQKLIEKEAYFCNSSSIMRTGCIILVVMINLFQPANSQSIESILEKYFPNIEKIIVWICKISVSFSMLTLLAHPLQMLYGMQHIKYQLLMFNTLIDQLMSIVSNQNEAELYRQDVYQYVVESRLKMLKNRHTKFIFFTQNMLACMNHLIIPFSGGAVFICISLAFSVFSISESTTIFAKLRLGMFALISLMSITSLINACQEFENESENIFWAFSRTPWYTWNYKNRKTLALILQNSLRPMQLKFSDNLAINYNLGVKLSKIVYSAVSLFGDKINQLKV